MQNGFMYLCTDSDGNFWIRSVNGDWSQLEVAIASTDDLDTDFQQNQSQVVPSDQIISDNTDQTVDAVGVMSERKQSTV